MSRLDRLREMRAWIDAEIREETERLSSFGADTIVASCANLYGTTVADILAGNRCKAATKARQAACWLLRREGLSFSHIGQLLDLDHTTVMHACRKIDGTPAIRALITRLEAA